MRRLKSDLPKNLLPPHEIAPDRYGAGKYFLQRGWPMPMTRDVERFRNPARVFLDDVLHAGCKIEKGSKPFYASDWKHARAIVDGEADQFDPALFE